MAVYPPFLAKYFIPPKWLNFWKVLPPPPPLIRGGVPTKASVIQNYNTNILKDPVASTAKQCSCWQNSNCPLAEKCLSECLLYHAQVNRSDINQTKNHYGTCKKNFQRALQQTYYFF